MRSVAVRSALAVLTAAIVASCTSTPWPPGVQDVPAEAPVLAPDRALETFYLPPGFGIEIVAAEPMVEDPVAIDFDADGRMWVVEMRGYMPNVDGTGERTPNGRITVLEDVDGDGRMDERAVFLDSLVLPRAVKALDRGILVAEPPYLWLARDTTGDLRADVKEVVRDDYGRRASNPERNPNGLVWGLDNTLLSVWHDQDLRVDAKGNWSAIPTLHTAQWGVSVDDFGYAFKNSNADPLRIDLIPATYYARNPNLERRQGAYVDLVDDDSVWPVRPTPGINRGYQDHMLREDSTLAIFTAAGSPVVYRGDRLPPELVNDVFVSEPAGNLVRRFAVERGADGSMTAANPYQDVQGEFLASTDERFRPVNLYSAPDGTLYVVDFYRGIVQHRDYLTEYLEDYILKKGLDRPLGMGRIYRITHKDYERDERPRLSDLSAAELAEVLRHPNGWWRDAAQRLIVERGDTSAVNVLREMVTSAGDESVRLHALWTLDGLNVDVPHAASEDASPYVRSAWVRHREGTLDLLDVLDEVDPIVRRQVAASIGTLPGAPALESVAALLVRQGTDSIAVDAALSGVYGREAELLEFLLAHRDAVDLRDAIAMATAAALNGGERDVVFAASGEEDRPAWQRLAILHGILAFAPEPPEDTTRWSEFEPHALDDVPAGLITAAESDDEDVRRAAGQALDRFTWPGKPRPDRPDVRPLSAREQELFDRGRDLYLTTCSVCHGTEGQGREAEGPALAGARWVNGDEDPLIRILLHGLEGNGLMPPQRRLSDGELAAVLTYIRRAWGHRGSVVTEDEVEEVRGRTASRDRPWTEQELGE
ncbi:MAG: c-type cytochrome [Rhodothermales bacterium]